MGADERPLGTLVDVPIGAGTWRVDAHEGAKATLAPAADGSMRIEIAHSQGNTPWHVQLISGTLALDPSQDYELWFDASASPPRKFVASASQAHAPWNNLGLYHSVDAGEQVQSFKLAFRASAADSHARIHFDLGEGAAGRVDLRNVALKVRSLAGAAAPTALPSQVVEQSQPVNATPAAVGPAPALAPPMPPQPEAQQPIVPAQTAAPVTAITATVAPPPAAATVAAPKNGAEQNAAAPATNSPLALARNIALSPSQLYALEFRARSTTPGKLHLRVNSADGAANLGLDDVYEVAPDWANYYIEFVASAEHAQAVVDAQLESGASGAEFAAVRVVPIQPSDRSTAAAPSSAPSLNPPLANAGTATAPGVTSVKTSGDAAPAIQTPAVLNPPSTVAALAPASIDLSSGWNVISHDVWEAMARPTADGATRIEIRKAGSPPSWHLQFLRAGVPVDKGDHFRVSFRARADRPRPISLALARGRQPWDVLGMYRDYQLTDQWQNFSYEFDAVDRDDAARLYFDLAAADASIELADFHFANTSSASEASVVQVQLTGAQTAVLNEGTGTVSSGSPPASTPPENVATTNLPESTAPQTVAALPAGWRFIASAAQPASAEANGNGVRLSVLALASGDNAARLTTSAPPLAAGQHARLRLRVRADKVGGLRCGVFRPDAPWSRAGVDAVVDVGTQWADIELTFVAASRVELPELNFAWLGEPTQVELADVRLEIVP